MTDIWLSFTCLACLLGDHLGDYTWSSSVFAKLGSEDLGPGHDLGTLSSYFPALCLKLLRADDDEK